MYNSSITNGAQLFANNNYRQVFIQEKNAPSGVSFGLTNTTTVGDICAIVARALNCNKDISIQMSEKRLPNELVVGIFSDAAIKQITYSVTNIMPNIPSSATTTNVVTPFFHWSVVKDSEGNDVLKFKSDNNMWNFNLNNPVPNKNPTFIPTSLPSTNTTTPFIHHDETFSTSWSSSSSSINNLSDTLAKLNLEGSQKPPVQTEHASPEINKNEPAFDHLKKFISSERKLYKIEENGSSYLKDIAILKNMDKNGEKILLPLDSWAVYLVKGDKFHLCNSLNHNPTYGDVASTIGRIFSVRVGKITKTVVNTNGYTLNVPLPRPFAGLFDNVVVEHNLTDRMATHESLEASQKPPVQTEHASPEINKNEPAFDQLKKFISSKRKLYKIDENGSSYLKDIAILKNMDNKGEPILLPRNSWAVYLVKGDTYHLCYCPNNNPTYGDVASTIGRMFSVRVGKITKTVDNTNGYTLNVPLPSPFTGMFDKVVIQHNLTDLIATHESE